MGYRSAGITAIFVVSGFFNPKTFSPHVGDAAIVTRNLGA